MQKHEVQTVREMGNRTHSTQDPLSAVDGWSGESARDWQGVNVETNERVARKVSTGIPNTL